MTAPAPSLRDRQAEQVRTAVLDAAVAALETKAVDDIAMAEVAAAAGISLRTLYRYFPDRASLLHAAGDRVYASLGVPQDIASADDIAPSFLDAARRLSARPELTRALVQTTAGREARSAARVQRVGSIRNALAPLTADLDPDLARRATAIVTHLCSAASWLSVADESGLAPLDAQQAVAWAIDTLVHSLTDQQATASRAPKA
jgi:AcrR family transcriptional regulator